MPDSLCTVGIIFGFDRHKVNRNGLLWAHDEVLHDFSRHVTEHGLPANHRGPPTSGKDAVMVGSRSRSAAILALVVTGTTALAHTKTAAGFDHVRSDRAPIRALLASGYERSATFRRLVDDIGQLPGIVYITETVKLSQCMDGALLHTVGGSGQTPILRVVIKTNLAGDYAIGILAHELQHVAETLRAGLTSGTAMGVLFASLDRDGSSSKFETEEARLVAARVIEELRGRAKR